MLSGQLEFSPAGAEWCYKLLPSHDQAPGHLYLVYDRDTVIAERALKIIAAKGRRVHPDGSEQFFDFDFHYFQSHDSIYYYAGEGIPDAFLFKLSYEEGETTTSYLFNAEFTVREVKTVEFYGKTVEKYDLTLKDSDRIPTTIYNIFGPNRGFVEGWWADVISGDNYELLAYKDQQTPTVSLKIGESCFGFFNEDQDGSSSNAPRRNPQNICPISAHPNPVSTNINIQFSDELLLSDEFELSITNILGNTALLTDYQVNQNSLEINLSRYLPTGYYILKMKSSCGEFTYPFIKVFE